MVNFPASLDTLANPTGAQVQGSTTPTHSGHHTNANDILEALEAKLGIGASTATANTVLRGTGTGATAFGQIVNADIAAAAGIPYSKLNLAGSIVTADLATNAATRQTSVVGVTSEPSIASTTPTYIPELLINPVTGGGGPALASFSSGFYCSSQTGNAILLLDFYLNGASVAQRQLQFANLNLQAIVSLNVPFTAPSGTYSCGMAWSIFGTGTFVARFAHRSLAVVEHLR